MQFHDNTENCRKWFSWYMQLFQLQVAIYKLLTVGVERCRHAPPSLVMWPVNFMRGLAPPHSASTNSRIAMATQGRGKPNQTTWELRREWIDALLFFCFVLDNCTKFNLWVNGIMFIWHQTIRSHTEARHWIAQLWDEFKNIHKR